MKTRTTLLSIAIMLLALFACPKQSASAAQDNEKRDQDLPLTFGGFLKDGSRNERIDGTCSLNATRTILDCDLYNGLPGWTLTQVTLVVTWAPYEQDEVRYFKVRVVIRPFTTEHASIRLGVQLPPDDVLPFPRRERTTWPHWHWTWVGARGYPAK